MAVRPTHNSLGDRVRARRKALRPKLSQEELAEAVGLTHGSISRLERGKVKRVSPELLQALADALQCKPSDLMAEQPEEEAGLRQARELLERIDPEDLPQAVRALRGFVSDKKPPPAKRPAKKRQRDRA